MKLIVQPLAEGPIQKFRATAARRLHISRAALWVYGHNIQAGDQFRFQIRKNKPDGVIAEQLLTGAQIKTLCDVTEPYFHAKLFLDFGGDVLLEKGGYRISAEQLSGHDATHWLSWCRDWERPYGTVNPAPTADWNSPFYLRLYDREGREL